MNKRIFLLLFLMSNLSVWAQKKPYIRVAIVDPGQLFSTFAWNSDQDKTSLFNQVTETDYNGVLMKGKEDSWPVGISDFSQRINRKADLVKYVTYQIATIDKYVVLKIPRAENKHMPADMQAGYDFYFVMDAKAVSASGTKSPSNPSTQTTASNQVIKTGRIDSLALVLAIPDELSSGSNGAGIAYDPVKKLYYTAMAGNTGYPLVVFDSKGSVLTSGTTLTDVRGIWYNPISKNIEANGYADSGIGHYIRDAKGYVTDFIVDFPGQIQPFDNACGAINQGTGELVFMLQQPADELDLGSEYYTYIELLNPKDMSLASSVWLDPQNKELIMAGVNYTSLGFTGILGAEIALLHDVDRKVCLYNLKTGEPAYELSLGDDIPLAEAFNFTYANKLFWFFDKTAREWRGYKMKLK